MNMPNSANHNSAQVNEPQTGACASCGALQSVYRFCIKCGQPMVQFVEPGALIALVPATPAKVAPRFAIAGVATPGTADRLPRVLPRGGVKTVHWIGVHGGAGEHTLASAVPGSVAAGHGWPTLAAAGNMRPLDVPIALVARTHMRGLLAAQLALREWASGAVSPTRMLGLVLVADSPGRLPKPLKDLQRIVSGGADQVWNVPFLEQLRLRSRDDLPPTDSSFEAIRRAIAKQL